MLSKKSIFIPFIIIIASCNGQVDKKATSNFKPSYKEIITTRPDSIGFIEFYDSTSNIYSNFKYGFSIKFPEGWSIDKGFSEHTIIRGYQEEYAATFSVNVIEVNVENNTPFSLWKYFDENKSTVESQNRNQIEKLINSTISDYSVRKIYLDNQEALQREFVYTLKNIDSEIQMKGVMYQVTNVPFIYTVGLHVPLLFYNDDTNRFNALINGFYFNYKKSN